LQPRSGIALLEALAILAVLTLIAAAALPALATMRGEALAALGARHIALTLQSLRWRSVARGQTHGLRFVHEDQGWCWYRVLDGDGDGLRSSDIDSGTDPTLSGPHRLEQVASGVRLGFAGPGPFPGVPPDTDPLQGDDDPIRFGSSDLVSFGPLGTSSSGKIFLSDPQGRMYAVVLYGRTAKVRLWKYSSEHKKWTS